MVSGWQAQASGSKRFLDPCSGLVVVSELNPRKVKLLAGDLRAAQFWHLFRCLCGFLFCFQFLDRNTGHHGPNEPRGESSRIETTEALRGLALSVQQFYSIEFRGPANHSAYSKSDIRSAYHADP